MRVGAVASGLLAVLAYAQDDDVEKDTENEPREYTGGPCECTGDNSQIPPDHPHNGTEVGTYCAAWDKDTDLCIQGTTSFEIKNLQWCRSNWCYVKEDCWITFEGENKTSSKTVYYTEGSDPVDLWWSYETCGFPNKYSGTWNWTFTKCPRRRPNDVYFLIDSSGSVLSKRMEVWHSIQYNTAHFINGMELNDEGKCQLDPTDCGDRAGIMLFGGVNDKIQGFVVEDTQLVSTLTYDLSGLIETAENMSPMTVPGRKTTHHTWTLLGIRETLNTWRMDEDLGNNRVLIIFTDGKPNPPGNRVTEPGTENQNPCDATNGNIAIVDELKEFGVRVIIYTLKKEFDTLNCLVEDPTTDVVFVADPEKLFDILDHNIFCTKEKTSSPTLSPTLFPSYFPSSASPTEMPSEEPTTSRPTKMPTDRPSGMPTDRPSYIPSYIPTYLPTIRPTGMPTDRPSALPSFSPSGEPTPAPSPRPTPMPVTPSPTECQATEVKKPLKSLKSLRGKGECGKKKKKRCNSCEDCTWADVVCLDKLSGGEVCAHIIQEATCMDLRNCKWSQGLCKQRDPNMSGSRWKDTHGPHFWQTCAENFCNRYTWYGGISRCHFDPAKHGCGCMGLDQGECEANPECQFKNCECGERTPCEKLTFDQCTKDDRCRVCNEGCVRKCELGPDQDVPDFVSLKLIHSTCKCEMTTDEVCSKKCVKQ